MESNKVESTDLDDYTERIFHYLNENEHQSKTTIEKDLKPLLCAFCPFFARNIQEFQIHIAKHTEKNFRCLLCNCMYKYRRDCVTHMKRKHSTNVNGSMSQYIQKIGSASTNVTSTPMISTSNPSIEAKRYGCPYCSLMTKSTSSIYKHQSRKHASYPKIVHKYSTDDNSNGRNLVAILKQKPLKKLISMTDESTGKTSICDQSNVSSSSTETTIERCSTSKEITSDHLQSTTTEHSRKFYQCHLCSYRAHHQANLLRHLKEIHSIVESSENLIAEDREKTKNYSFQTTVRAPLTSNETKLKAYADVHLSINIFLPTSNLEETASESSQMEISSGAEGEDEDDDESNSLSHQQNTLANGSLYKPHKCRRCFYRSNWKTDMLHHIRLKHQLSQASKSDYISMDFQSALRTFPIYEKTFGKVLKNRLLLPKIDYINCTWEELKCKLFLSDDFNEQIHSTSPTKDNDDDEDQLQSVALP